MFCKVDHLVITAKNVNSTISFYEKLGFVSKKSLNRTELFAGDFKINVHTLGEELSPHATNVRTGSADFCLEWKGDIEQLLNSLTKQGLTSNTGIVARHGVNGAMKSVYFYDPDGNLVEICSYG